MIVGIDHIAFSVSDIEKAVSEVASWGYRAAFVEKGVLNHRAKIPFLREWRKKHDIAYCQSTGLAIELTCHSEPQAKNLAAPYQIRFSESWPKRIETIILKTSDLERSIVFWSKLGFKKMGKSELCFVTPVADKNLYLRLVHTPKTPRHDYYLDDNGFPCLALLTTHIERDRLLFGETVSDIFSLTIHHRSLNICLGRGPDGECVELIAIKKGV